MAEILTQIVDPVTYFAMVLNLQPGRHRYTLELMRVAFNFASYAGQRFKHHFRIVRPADRSSLVQPMIQTPGHSSYPAGHAVQMYLVKDVLAYLLGIAPPPVQEKYSELNLLAARVSENRIVAGMHYKTDIDQGASLGAQLAVYLNKKLTIPNSALNWLWTQANAEK